MFQKIPSMKSCERSYFILSLFSPLIRTNNSRKRYITSHVNHSKKTLDGKQGSWRSGTNRMLLWMANLMYKKKGYFILGSACGSGAATAWFLWSYILLDQNRKKLENETQKSNQSSDIEYPVSVIDNLKLVEMTDELYEKNDNLCVFCVRSIEDLRDNKVLIQCFEETLESFQLPFSVLYCYTFTNDPTKTGDFRLSTTHNNKQDIQEPLTSPRVILHRGFRKLSLDLTDWKSDQVLSFFSPLSEEAFCESPHGHQAFSHQDTCLLIPHVTYNTYAKEVVEASSPEAPIVVQLVENSCFLCFLMRPFINTVASILEKEHCALKFKRLNVEKNDFPANCPVIRSTPSFVEYRGPIAPGETPIIWNEYKPQDLIKRLVKECSLSPASIEQLSHAVEQLQERFQKFALLTLWTQELRDLQRLYNELSIGEQSNQDALESEYTAIVSDLVSQDNCRVDTLEENLKYIEESINSIQMDCLAFAKVIGDETLQQIYRKFPKRLNLIKTSLLSEKKMT